MTLKSIAFANSKGGVGKTTLAVNLAVRAAMGHIPELDSSKRVLILDMDGQQNTSSMFLKMERIGDVAVKQIPIHPEYDETLYEDWNGRSSSTDIYYNNDVVPYPTVFDRLDILPANGDQLSLFMNMANSADRDHLEEVTEHFKRFVLGEDVAEEYDLMVFDTPPGVNFITIPVFRACTHVIVPLTPEPMALDGLSTVIGSIRHENEYRQEPVSLAGIVPNNIDSRLRMHKDNLQHLLASKETADLLWSSGGLSSRVAFKLEDFPINPQSYIYKDAKAENEMSEFINEFRRRIYHSEDTATFVNESDIPNDAMRA